MNKKVFALDSGKASIGYCVREGLDIKEAASIIIDKDHAEITSKRDRKRAYKTLLAHKKREEFFNKIWTDCGLNILEKNNPLFKKEFGKKNDKTIYNSTLLRIALLQELKLEEWQIYKAIHSAIQRRGYDSNLPWANANSKNSDDEENEKLSVKYTQENDIELIENDKYKYPCFYDAARLGLWSEENPKELNNYIPLTGVIKVRTAGLVAPRNLVEKELTALWENAQKQLPQLNKITTEYFLYGEYEEAYGSYKNIAFKQFRGKDKDWQGVLGQKIPRFDNRIIMKCKLLPKRNVSKAATIENITFTLLMKLKNLRLNTIDTALGKEKRKLTASEIKEILETKIKKDNWEEKLLSLKDGKNPSFTITKTDIESVIGKKSILDKLEPLKANVSGRSSFCRRACKIMNKIIITGLNPMDIDISEFIDKPGTRNGITEEEIREMLTKVGEWDNLYIPDNRNTLAQINADTREKTDILIGNITNPIVRNRLQIIRDLLFDLKEKYGNPDEVILEFIREGADKSLMPGKKASDLEKYMKQQEKLNQQLAEELKAVDAYSPNNFDKFKLLKMQDMKCIYSGKPIGISDLDKCEIDHIYPRTLGGNDALYNRVLCYKIENQDKGGRTPYQWLKNDDKKWQEYFSRLQSIKIKLGKKKFELLTSKPEECKEIIDSYNGLAETAQIARVTQEIVSLIFGWGMQTAGDKRHVFVSNGSTTSAIRRRYGLNKILGDDIKKNRDNDKHHALDAICISFSRNYKYNKELKADVIPGFTYDMVKNAIDKIMPYPYTNAKPFKGNTKPLETIYGLRNINGKFCIVKKTNIISFEPKEKKIKTIVDEVIKADLLNKLEENPTSSEWTNMLKEYKHPKKQTLVRRVLTIESEGQMEKDSNGRNRIGEYCDFGCKETMGQYKHSKGHKGQILYYNDKGEIKVMPVYSNKKTQDVKDKLISMGCKLYNKGTIFYSGCLLEIPKEFKAGKETYPAGIYKLRTIISTGQIKLESNTGTELLTSAKILSDINFSKYKKPI